MEFFSKVLFGICGGIVFMLLIEESYDFVNVYVLEYLEIFL